jgi:S-adenosylmethionine:tRNA ribosyltransferase-isomerase
MYRHMQISEFDFNLPEELIVQEALPDRSASRLLVMDRGTGQVNHAHVRDLVSILKPGDLLVVNNSRVMPARLLGQVMKGENMGISAECFLLKRLSPNTWESLIKPGKKIGKGDVISCQRDGRMLAATVKEKKLDGKVVLEIPGDAEKLLEEIGHMPLPPYIKRPDTLDDKSRYQTVYAKPSGSVAAPTAGLHFTPELISSLKRYV